MITFFQTMLFLTSRGSKSHWKLNDLTGRYHSIGEVLT